MKTVILAALFLSLSAAADVPWIESQPASAIPTDGGFSIGPGWHPTGDQRQAISSECHWLRLEKAILDAGSNETAAARRTREWFARCGERINGPSRGRIADLARFARLDYSLRDNSALKRVTFRLSDGRRLRGIAAFKSSSRPRPLVIFACGLFCNAGDSVSPRSLVMQLFEESPFHVLVLASPSGSTFSKENKSVALSGFDGGAQIVDVMRQVLRSGLRPRISSVHLLGVSLGSHAAGYAALYASEPANGVPKISSVTATCSVVDLGASIEAGFTGALRGSLYEYESRDFLRNVGDSIPVLNEFMSGDPGGFDRRELQRLFALSALAYYESFLDRRPWPLQPFEDLRLRGLRKLVEVNRFQNYAARVRVPMMYLYSKDDGLVVPGPNSDRLAERLDGTNPSVSVVAFDRGNHCAIASAYGWRTMTVLLRSRILAHAPERGEFLRTTSRLSLPALVGARVDSYGWELAAGSDQVTLRVNGGRWRLPVRQFAASGLRAPVSATEANRMSRWMNANAWLADREGRDVTGRDNAVPAEVRVRDRYEL